MKQKHIMIARYVALEDKSNMLKKVFKHKSTGTVRTAKFNKASLYEKKLPSIVLVVTLKNQ